MADLCSGFMKGREAKCVKNGNPLTMFLFLNDMIFIILIKEKGYINKPANLINSFIKIKKSLKKNSILKFRQ
jgi:hypothetical protein